MPFNKVKLGLYAMNAIELVDYSSLVVNEMTGNPNFPMPNPDLVSVSAIIDVLNVANIDAANGGRLQYALRDMAFEELKTAMRVLGAYVENQCQGVKSKILSSGMQVHKQKEKVGILSAPIDVRSKVSDHSGRIDLRWKRVDKNKGYTVYMCSADPFSAEANWTPIGTTTKSKFTINDLNPATFYWFKVATISSDGTGGFSDIARGLAA